MVMENFEQEWVRACKVMDAIYQICCTIRNIISMSNNYYLGGDLKKLCNTDGTVLSQFQVLHLQLERRMVNILGPFSMGFL